MRVITGHVDPLLGLIWIIFHIKLYTWLCWLSTEEYDVYSNFVADFYHMNEQKCAKKTQRSTKQAKNYVGHSRWKFTTAKYVQ